MGVSVLKKLYVFRTDGVRSTVTVNRPPAVGCKGQRSPYASNAEYIQVIIHSNVDTSLAKIIGINQTQNCTEAVARAQPANKEKCSSAMRWSA